MNDLVVTTPADILAAVERVRYTALASDVAADAEEQARLAFDAATVAHQKARDDFQQAREHLLSLACPPRLPPSKLWFQR